MEDHRDEFLKLLLKHQNQIYAFIATFLTNAADAEDLFQQVCLICWKKWDTFDPEARFTPWACGIARYEILNHLRKSKYRQAQHLSDEIVGTLSKSYMDQENKLGERRQALHECMDKLADDDRKLVNHAYQSSGTIKSLAEQVGVSVDRIYARLRKLRKSLLLCITRELG